MDISGSSEEYNIGEQSSIYSVDATFKPSNAYKDFSIEGINGSNRQFGIYFSDGLVTDHNDNLLAAYNTNKTNIKLNLDSENNLYDFFFNESPLGAEMNLGNYNADTLKISSSEVNVNYSFDVFSNSIDSSIDSSLSYDEGSGIGYIINNSPGDLIINNINVPNASGVYLNSFDSSPIPSGQSGQYVLDFSDNPGSGQIYSISVDTNYGSITNYITVDSLDDDSNFFTFDLFGPNKIFAKNGEAEGLYVVEIESSQSPTGFEVSFEYVSGNESVYEYQRGTGIGAGDFSGYIDTYGYLICSEAVGVISADNGYSLSSGIATGTAYSRYYYAVGSNNFLFKTLGSGVLDGHFLETGSDTGFIDPGFTGTGTGNNELEITFNNYPTKIITGDDPNFIYGYITGELTATTSSESESGIAYVDQVVTQIPDLISSGFDLEDNLNNYELTGIFQKRIPISGYFTYNTTGYMQGHIKVKEGDSTFLDRWNLETGSFYTGDTTNFSAFGYYDGDKYINTSYPASLGSGLNTFYLKLNYNNSFRGGHSDVGRLSVKCNGETQSILVTGFNNKITIE